MAANDPQAATHRRASKETEKIGSFQRQEEIGRGSFATVYKAINTSPQGVQSLVAIKSVNLGKLNKKLKDNLTSEISILKGLHHPHIVALIDCKESSAHIHLVMEYVALGDLSYFIKKRDTIKNNPMVGNMMDKYPNPRVGGLHEVVVRHFLQQLASALQFLRARNLIHRDVKPQNLLLNPSSEYFEKHKPVPMPYCAGEDSLTPICGIKSLPMLKIADFGFARSLPATSLAETLCGSPLYMAPEILRYEKYDAKADLWSVGTVLYEMVTSKPPFRASNHVELLRRIEKGEDRIKFPEDTIVSDGLKKLIRALLKRDPRERLSFPDFFSNELITGSIPGLAPEDMPRIAESVAPRAERRKSSRTDPIHLTRPGAHKEPESPYLESDRTHSADDVRRNSVSNTRRLSEATQQPDLVQRPSNERTSSSRSPTSPTGARPPLPSHSTAPGRQELLHRNPAPASAAMARQTSGGARPPSLLRNQIIDNNQVRLLDQQEEIEKERAAQDIAFERDYVVVDKGAVQVNALADELEASPKLNRGALQTAVSPKSVAMVRRATTQGTSSSAGGAQANASRAVQIASGRRPDMLHNRQNSYERRYGPSPISATSAISKALNMASGRLFGVGFSPPVNIMRGGRSPPVGYSPFPVYPGSQSSLVVVGESKPPISDEDTRFVQNVEEIATRSDIVYGFAEVKYKQLTPPAPSANPADPGVRQTSDTEGSNALSTSDDELTVQALVTVSEEALVLYVKALALLAKAMDIAARWWAHKNQIDAHAEGGARSLASSAAVGQRMNNVVQWVRNRFNEVLEKADLVRLKLLDSQKRLPLDHPSHPSNVSATTGSSAGMGTSTEHIVVSSGITAEKLMYDRALEMSRSAAINELTGEDLPGCEISYVTAIRMLEAVLENDEDVPSRKSTGNSNREKNEAEEHEDDDAPINGLEAEDRKAVKNIVTSLRQRLANTRKKLQVIQKRASAPAIGSPRASPPISYRGSAPKVAATPPQ